MKVNPPPAVPPQTRRSDHDAHINRLLDAALADTFPASDPVSSLVPDEPREWKRSKADPDV